MAYGRRQRGPALCSQCVSTHTLNTSEGLTTVTLVQNMRPELPLGRAWSSQLLSIVNACWHSDPHVRPPFVQIEVDLHALRKHSGSDTKDSPLPPPPIELLEERKSPDMHPVPLPLLPRK